MKTNFWDKHYSSFQVMKPSPFAEFCADRFLHSDDLVIEIGCGNGRDAQHLAPRVAQYYGIDACPKASDLCRESIGHVVDYSDIESRVINGDASTFDYASKADPKHRTVIYSRFSIHSMNYQEEARLLEALAKIEGSVMVLIEVRTIFDTHYNVGRAVGIHEFESDHYRRFVDPLVFVENFSRLGMPVFTSLASGQAAFGNEDPVVLRAVFDSTKMAARNLVCNS